MEAPRHILIYLKVHKDGTLLYRSPIRELRALGGVLVQIALDRLRSDDRNAWLGASLEYIDASSGRLLLAFEPEGRSLVIRGEIPDEYKKRLLSPAEAGKSVERAIEKLSPSMQEDERSVIEHTFRTRVDGLLRRIGEALDENGCFRFTVHRP